MLDERGSALVLVLLVLLALSALGMVGMRNVSQSMQQSGTFRARSAANMYADASAHFMAYQLGNRAQEIWGSMERYGAMQRNNYESNTNQTSNKLSRRDSNMEQGETIRFVYDESTGRNDLSSFLNQTKGQDSGFFTWKQGQRSFETQAETTRFEIVIRNPVDMPAPSGYSKDYCFKKVTIAAEAELGDPTSSWKEPRPIGVGRTMLETMVGPIQCE